jgi:tetratricopeptide (TPR) repeat protein
MRHAYLRIAALIVIASLVAGCAASRAFSRADDAARAGDWETAVDHYRRAVQEDPMNAEYRIALERAMISASHVHLDAARVAEVRGNLDEALRSYRRASEFDPPNRQLADKVAQLERTLRDQIEAARPRNSVAQMREQARQGGPPPLFNLTTVMAPIRFVQSSLRDIFSSIAKTTGINITFDSTFQDRVYTVELSDVTLEQALNQIVTANQLFYKVLDPKTILVIPDNAQKRAQYEEQLVQNFYISHVDPLELAQMLNQVIRPIGGQQLAPVISANKAASVINVRATTAMMAIIERMIESNDKPRAEVIVDVQILEVNRSRAKKYGIDLGNYAINAVFSPERDPRGTGTAGEASLNAQPFNANTITRGISANDFYLAVPSAVIRFLENDSETRIIAKPQLRGAEGAPLELNLGEDIPVPSTTFTPVAAGGANSQPLTSFNYRSVGVNVKMTSKVSFEGDIRMELFVESSTLGAGVVIAGQELPVVRIEKSDDRAEAPRRRVIAARRAPSRGSAEAADGLSVAVAGAGHQAALLEQRHQREPERYRHAPDAAHRSLARAHTSGRRSASHRHAIEPRPERSAAAARSASRSRSHSGRCRRGPAACTANRTSDSASGATACTACAATSADAWTNAATGAADPRSGSESRHKRADSCSGSGATGRSTRRRTDPGLGAAGIPRRSRALYRSDLHHRRIADLERLTDGDIQPGCAQDPRRAGRSIPAVGWHPGLVHAAG